MEEAQNFCLRCGANLQPDLKFCSECGARIPGRNPEQVEEEKQAVRDVMRYRLNWAVALMLIYSVPFLIIGLYLLVDLDEFINTIITDPLYTGYVDYYGWTQDDLHEVLQVTACTYILSSVCGIASAVLSWKRIRYWIAVVLIMSMFTGAMGLFTLFMWMFAFWTVLTNKLAFREYQSQLKEELGRIQ